MTDNAYLAMSTVRKELEQAYREGDDLDSNHARWVVGRTADRLGIALSYPPANEPNNRLREQLAEEKARHDDAPVRKALSELLRYSQAFMVESGRSKSNYSKKAATAAYEGLMQAHLNARKVLDGPETIEQMAAAQGIGPVKNAGDLRLDVTEEEADAFEEALKVQPSKEYELSTELVNMSSLFHTVSGDKLGHTSFKWSECMQPLCLRVRKLIFGTDPAVGHSCRFHPDGCPTGRGYFTESRTKSEEPPADWDAGPLGQQYLEQGT